MPSTDILIERAALARLDAVAALEEIAPDNPRVKRLVSYKDAPGILAGGESDHADVELFAVLCELLRDLSKRDDKPEPKAAKKSSGATSKKKSS